MTGLGVGVFRPSPSGQGLCGLFLLLLSHPVLSCLGPSMAQLPYSKSPTHELSSCP